MDANLGEDNDVLAREFFLEFSDNLLLDFLPGLDLWLGHDDGNGFAARANVEFLGALNIERSLPKLPPQSLIKTNPSL